MTKDTKILKLMDFISKEMNKLEKEKAVKVNMARCSMNDCELSAQYSGAEYELQKIFNKCINLLGEDE